MTITTTNQTTPVENVYATITNIHFNFDVSEEYGISRQEQIELPEDTIGETFFIDTDDLEDIDEKISDTISDHTGWLVDYVEYQLTY
jgi:hypothetical protein